MGESARNPLVEREERGHRARFLILGAVLALTVGYMVYAAFPGNALYFLTVGEFINGPKYQDGRTLRVSGKLVEGSFQRPEASTLANFQLTDDGGGDSLSASYVGVMPDLFFNPHSEIILQGSYSSDQMFHADSILVKCPSKYRSLEEELRTEG